MTYCVGLLLKEGLIMASDTRTNAGVDNIATFRKLRIWERPGDRVVALAGAGNLAVTQSVISQLEERINAGPDAGETILSVDSMFKVARLVGDAVREVKRIDSPAASAGMENFSVSFLLGGQIGKGQLRLFQVYDAGNFIEASEDTPYFQIGEHKYGKPILDRVTTTAMPISSAVKLVLLSFDSTLRSNLSVGMPLDLLIYRRGALKVDLSRRITAEDTYFRNLSNLWSNALKGAFASIPEYDW
ncbi:MAG: peptidase [Pseudomonadota bacterium]|nr:peptidase [Pseudomonadota bacterium]